MGVAAIWEVIRPAFDERVPFPIFVTAFYQKHGRPLRIAIDAFQWIFECRVSQVTQQGPEFTARLLQNMHARLRSLIALNVSFVLVFDGNYKPKFKRNAEAQSDYSNYLEHRNFEKDYAEYRALINSGDFGRTDLSDIRELKKELKRWNIDYVDAPAEGEAEAAKLQSLGIVDYVVSNDTDTMIYGATHILRNFSKLEEDKPAGGATFKSSHSNHYWVTPVHMSNVLEVCGFDDRRIMLLSILAGADYNSGVTRIGIEKAAQIALSSTDKIKKYVATCPYTEFPDFANELHLIYKCSSETDKRKRSYKEFQENLFREVSENLIEYFGRNEKHLVSDKEFKGFPPDYVVMIYYYPLLATDDFKFITGSTNFAETEDASLWLKNPSFDESFRYYQANQPTNVTKVGTWFSKELTKSYLLKAIIYDIPGFEAHLEKTKIAQYGAEKDFDLEMVSVRYQKYFDYYKQDPAEYEDEVKTKRSPAGDLEWIPIRLIPETSKRLTDFLKRQEDSRKAEEESKKTKKGRSPRKSPKKNQATKLSNFDIFSIPPIPLVFDPLAIRKASSPKTKVSSRLFYPVASELSPPKSTSPAPPLLSSDGTLTISSDPNDLSLIEVPAPTELLPRDPTDSAPNSLDANSPPSPISNPTDMVLKSTKPLSPKKISLPKPSTRNSRKIISPAKTIDPPFYSPSRPDILELLQSSPHKRPPPPPSFNVSPPRINSESHFDSESLLGSESQHDPFKISPTGKSPHKFYMPINSEDDGSPSKLIKSRRQEIDSSPSRGSTRVFTMDHSTHFGSDDFDKARKQLDFEEKEVIEDGHIVVLLDSSEDDRDISMVNVSQTSAFRTPNVTPRKNTTGAPKKINRPAIGPSPKNLSKLDDSLRRSLLDDLEDDFDESMNDSSVVEVSRILRPPRNLKPLDLQTRTSLLESLEFDDLSEEEQEVEVKGNIQLEIHDDKDDDDYVPVRSKKKSSKKLEIPQLMKPLNTIDRYLSSPLKKSIKPAPASAEIIQIVSSDDEDYAESQPSQPKEQNIEIPLPPSTTARKPSILDEIVADWSVMNDTDSETDTEISTQKL